MLFENNPSLGSEGSAAQADAISPSDREPLDRSINNGSNDAPINLKIESGLPPPTLEQTEIPLDVEAREESQILSDCENSTADWRLEPIKVPGVPGEIEPGLKSMTAVLAQLWRHIKEPAGLKVNFQAVLAYLNRKADDPRRLSDVEEINEVSSFVLRQITRTYIGSLTFGCGMALLFAPKIQQAIDSPTFSMFAANAIDYLACTSCLAATWLAKFNKFYFRDQDKTACSLRRKFFVEMIKADCIVSASIYVLSFVASNLVYGISQIFDNLNWLSSYTGTTTALFAYALFLSVAAKNISNFGREMVPSFKAYWLADKIRRDKA